jgi:hypothetical protein
MGTLKSQSQLPVSKPRFFPFLVDWEPAKNDNSRPFSQSRNDSHESNDSDDLDGREDELSLSVALDAEEIYRYDQD